MPSDTWQALNGMMRRFAEAFPHGWHDARPGVDAVFLGVPFAFTNTVMVSAPSAPDDIRALYERLVDEQVPCSITTCTASYGATAELIAALGLQSEARETPLMTASPHTFVSAVPPPSLEIRKISASEAVASAQVFANGFGTSVDIAMLFHGNEVMALPECHYYVGAVDGIDVCVGMGAREGDWIGVFSIATLPEARGHGYGAAITSRVVADGFADGATMALLQASAMGESVYQRLGFTTVDRSMTYSAPAA